jgi:hypothetical protein
MTWKPLLLSTTLAFPFHLPDAGLANDLLLPAPRSTKRPIVPAATQWNQAPNSRVGIGSVWLDSPPQSTISQPRFS